MRLFLKRLLTLLLLLSPSALMAQTLHSLRTGDLLFVRVPDQSSPMEGAIVASTGSYVHVAVAEWTDSGLCVVEALPRIGVRRSLLGTFLNSLNHGSTFQVVDYCRPTVDFDTVLLRRTLDHAVGLPYDDYFLSDNGRYYCSELVYDVFRHPDGSPLFEAKPMNFRAADGSMPHYWASHFANLGSPIPEGLPGTNPTDMRKTPFLRLLD